MKNKWKSKNLGEICKISTGNSNTIDANSDGEYAFFDRSKKIKRSSRYLFDCEALIVPGEGSEFFPRYFSGRFDLHQRAYVLYNFIDDVDIKFVKYFLIFNHKYFERVAVGATAKSLRYRHFNDLKIDFPEILEQKKIVKKIEKVLSDIEIVKEATYQNLQNSRKLFEAYLYMIINNKNSTWEKRRLIDRAEFKGGGTPSKSNSSFWVGNIPWVSPKDMKTPVISDSQDHISSEAVNKSAVNLIPPGSILVVVRSGILARTIPIAITGRDLTINQDIKAIIPKGKLMNDYLYYFLKSSEKKLLKLVNKGATVHRLQSEFLANIMITVPSIEEQKEIVFNLQNMSEETKKLESLYQQKLILLEELKKSILHKAFSGQL